MKLLTSSFPSPGMFNVTILLFRIVVSVQLIVVHGLKKIGIGAATIEIVPNPLQLPETFNQWSAVSANLIFPCFVIIGLFTRIAALPIVLVTLTGLFTVHWNGPLAEKDIPFMYAVCHLLIASLGAGKYSVDYYFTRKPPLL